MHDLRRFKLLFYFFALKEIRTALNVLELGWQKALPLFESVKQNPKASQDIKREVRDYRELILDNPHKWLADSEEREELPSNERDHLPQTTTQPALPQLAYV